MCLRPLTSWPDVRVSESLREVSQSNILKICCIFFFHLTLVAPFRPLEIRDVVRSLKSQCCPHVSPHAFRSRTWPSPSRCWTSEPRGTCSTWRRWRCSSVAWRPSSGRWRRTTSRTSPSNTRYGATDSTAILSQLLCSPSRAALPILCLCVPTVEMCSPKNHAT